jgi:hypothetical protein
LAAELQLPALAPHVSAAAARTIATLPAVAAMFVEPVASGVGSAAPVAPPASSTRYERPGPIEPVSGVADQLVPAAVAYCTDQPVTSTADEPLLNSST